MIRGIVDAFNTGGWALVLALFLVTGVLFVSTTAED
jgi:hypothetical protein